ncbi:MAG: hypothetical protein LBT56_01330 [Prevotellaceae bacterium]|nr:hypothetical protein [Prevotellaceae bacterium]
MIIAAVQIFTLIFSLCLLFVAMTKEEIETLTPFLLPAIVVLDFSLRFFIKKNASAPIFSYLTLPIPRKALILYIVLSDLLRFWIWGCWLIYCGICWATGFLTLLNIINLLIFILLNNYIIMSAKALIGVYAILIYPFCLGFNLALFLVCSITNPFITVFIVALAVFLLVAATFYTLKENLYKELNKSAL